MKYKIIAFDLDGTLLTSDKQITERTFNALKKASDMGIQCVPCTGRFYEGMPKPVKDLDFVNYCININGASVFDFAKKKTIFASEMSKELAAEAYDYMKNIDVICDAYVDNWGYVSWEDFSKAEKYLPNIHYIENMNNFRTKVDDLGVFLRNLKTGVQKIQCYTPNEVLLNETVNYFKANYPNLEVSCSGVIDCELNDLNSTKGNALKKLADYLKVKPEEILAFGDGGNDVSMLEFAGMGVAMANAKQIAIDASDCMCLSNDEDGIAKYIEDNVF